MLWSCQEKNPNPNSQLSIDDYASLDTSVLSLNSHRVWEEIDSLSKTDEDSMFADVATRNIYNNKKSFLWVDRKGVNSRADSILNYLQCINSLGFSKQKFCLHQIENDLRRIRSLEFGDGDNRINKVIARLEYNLTKAYLRYAIGQQFGFMNPSKVFNKLDVQDLDTSKVSYHKIFDIKIKHENRRFVEYALHKVHVDSVAEFLRETEPKSPFYYALRRQLNSTNVDLLGKARIQVNMERCRWRMPDYPQAHSKYVLVNIPSFHLYAQDGDNELIMRVAFGSFESKTPLMISEIKKMEINPQWVMPRSIIKKSIIPHVGNVTYFDQRNYFIRNRYTGKIVETRQVTRQMLESGDYFVIQRGGEGNAMGRIVFRFDNDLAIYLHDTSSRDVFEKSDRDVSHGCVRVERPFDLAVFLLEEKESSLIDKISYSMTADVTPLGIEEKKLTDKMRAVADTLNKKMLIGSVNVTPHIPIFIIYYTLYPSKDGKIRSYPDVYGYDALIYKKLKNYI